MLTMQNSNTKSTVLYDFTDERKPNGWLIVNDGVMGGLSKGNITLDNDGNGMFWGHVSLANNGGFSLARLTLPSLTTEGYSKVVIQLKGDKKQYQFRMKSFRGQMHSYVKSFETSGKWEQIEIPFDELLPSFRGRRLDLPSYPADQLEEIGLLIGNKKEEDFKLLIRSIRIE
jgi:hypothetical protein